MKAFGDDVVLHDVDIQVRVGRILGVLGPGGGGKSLLLKMLCGLIQPDEGTVHVFERDLAELDTVEMANVRQGFGFLFQNYALFDFMTVGGNVGFPLRQRGGLSEEEIRSRVRARLTQVDLPGCEHLYPNELSGGMKKRVALARATIAEAPYLIYDDPTAGLDPVTSSKIFQLIKDLHQPKGMAVVAGHDVDRMVNICDDWLLLYEGQVHFYGDTAAALASEDPIVKTFFEADSGVVRA